MGGKSKIVDNNQLEQLYVQSRTFSLAASNSIEAIGLELKKLNDPTFQSSLSGGQGEAAKVAIKAVSDAVSEIKEALGKTTKFINKKLEGALDLAKDKNNFQGVADSAKSTGNKMLRK